MGGLSPPTGRAPVPRLSLPHAGGHRRVQGTGRGGDPRRRHRISPAIRRVNINAALAEGRLERDHLPAGDSQSPAGGQFRLRDRGGLPEILPALPRSAGAPPGRARRAAQLGLPDRLVPGPSPRVPGAGGRARRARPGRAPDRRLLRADPLLHLRRRQGGADRASSATGSRSATGAATHRALADRAGLGAVPGGAAGERGRALHHDRRHPLPRRRLPRRARSGSY